MIFALNIEKMFIIQGDVIKLDQVIYNLINNAINYSGEDHQVIVKQLLEHGKGSYRK